MYVAKQTKRHVDELLSERTGPSVKAEDRA